MPGRNYQSSTAYRYGFNGKENDIEVIGTGSGTQDYGMRIYNPALGKFLSVDPITDEYPELTPYQFAGNTPIVAIDLDGLETALRKTDGTFTTPRDGRLQQPVPPQYFEQFQDFGAPIKEDGLTMQTFQFFLEKPMAVFTGEDWEGNKVNRLEAAVTVIGNFSGGKGKGGAPKYGSKVKITKAEQIKINAAKGNRFEQKTMKAVSKKQTNVVQQITIKTKSGVKTKIDIVGKDKAGSIKLTEAKSSQTAPLTENQKAAFPEIEQTGGTVVGKGKEPFVGGTEIPATKVDIVRPDTPKTP